ncbi:MAG: hypothetical protein EBY16_05305 [Gammaproteobacteria bacterium]|nr:hypothetical protein [Gammaproteobacteria bacterium]
MLKTVVIIRVYDSIYNQCLNRESLSYDSSDAIAEQVSNYFSMSHSKNQEEFISGAIEVVKMKLESLSSESGAEECKSCDIDELAGSIVAPALVIFDELLAQKKAASVRGMAFKGAGIFIFDELLAQKKAASVRGMAFKGAGIFFGAGCACAAAALIVPPAAPVLALMAACSFALSMFFMLCALGAVAYDACINAANDEKEVLPQAPFRSK